MRRHLSPGGAFLLFTNGGTGPPCQAFNLARNGRKRRKGRQASGAGPQAGPGPGGAGRLPADPVADLPAGIL